MDHNPRQPEAADADRLSALDDATLHAILDRLPLRDAAATTALSRRWPRVFATLPRLRLLPATFNRRDFDDGGDEEYCESAERWVDSLGRVLLGRAAPVAAFEIEVRFMGLYDDWFDAVFRALCGSGGLLELRVENTKCTDCYPLPSHVYGCKTLTSLDLYNWQLRLPGRITGLAAVRSLVLRDAVAEDADLRRLVSRCSAMERLEIVNIHKARNIVINAPNLEKLKIYTFRPLCIAVKKAPRLDTVMLSLSYDYGEHYWRSHDTMDPDREYSFAEIDEMCDFEEVAKREHEQTDEIKNMLTFLGGLGCTKDLQLYFERSYSKVLRKAKVSMPKTLPKKSYLLGLRTLTLTLDHNDEILASFVSCLLNSSPNLKDLKIRHCDFGHTVPLAAEFWEEQTDCVLNHLSSVTYFIDIDAPFEGPSCMGLCQFLVMNARILRRMSIRYVGSRVRPEHTANLEVVRRELLLWPRASPDVLLELSPRRHYPFF